MNYKLVSLLTTDAVAVPKDPSNLWIHVDHHVLIFSELCVPRSDSFIHPNFELIANSGVDDVTKVSSWKLVDFFLFRREASHHLVIWFFLSILPKIFHIQTFIVRNLNDFDIFGIDFSS